MGFDTKTMGGGAGSNLGVPDIGLHPARLVGLIDMGIQERQPYQGKSKSPCGQLNVTFELKGANDRVEVEGVDRPRWLSKKFNCFSGANADLPTLVSALDPTGSCDGNLDRMIGFPCMVNVIAKTDANGNAVDGVRIDTVTAVMPDYNVQELENPPVVFNFDEPDLDTYNKLVPWIRDQLIKANNFKGSALEKLLQAAPAQAAPAQAAPAQAAPAQAAPAQAAPAAPPGFTYDAETNSFIPDEGSPY